MKLREDFRAEPKWLRSLERILCRTLEPRFLSHTNRVFHIRTEMPILFIYYVDTVDTTFTEYTRFNGTYVDTVDMIELQCKS